MASLAEQAERRKEMNKVYDKKEQAVRITSHLNDFDGDVQKWKLSFYEVWRYQLTWSFAYELSVNESRVNGVYIDLLVKPEYEKAILETMEDMGYREIKSNKVNIGIIYGFEHDELEDVDYVGIDW